MRPRRIAFLLDLSAPEADGCLDAVVDFNIDVWGGRYNPIIEVANGQLSPSEWKLLKIVDPDIIYVFGKLTIPTIEQIAKWIQPIKIEEHGRYGSRAHVDIRNQADTSNVIASLHSRVQPIIGRNDPGRVLNLHTIQRNNRSRFLRRNFGDSFVTYSLVNRGEIAFGVAPKAEATDAEVVQLLAANSNLWTPMMICAEAPNSIRFESDDSWEGATVFYGDDPATYRDYWNDKLFHTHYFGRSGQALGERFWLPTTAPEDPALWKAFVELLVKYTPSFNNQRHVSFVSRTVDEPELEALMVRVCTEGRSNLARGRVTKTSKIDYPDRIDRRMWGERMLTKYFHVSGNEVHLDLDLPNVVRSGNRDAHYVVEIYIEDPTQERVHVSQEGPWWWLPKRGGVPRLFSELPGRVTNDGLLALDIEERLSAISIRIPSHERVLYSALRNSVDWRTGDDLRAQLQPAPLQFTLEQSEKGKYLQGLSTLFGGTTAACSALDHPMWSKLLVELSRFVPSEHLINEVRAKIERLRTRSESFSNRESADFIREIVEKMSHHRPAIPFSRIQGWMDELVNALNPERKEMLISMINPEPNPPSDEAALIKQYLVNEMSWLLSRGVCFQGASLECTNCRSKLWYDLRELNPVLVCRGCRGDIHVPAEVEWLYSLNELARVAIGRQGLTAVFRTLARLFSDYGKAFFFTSGVEVRNPDTRLVLGDLDLLWSMDGKLGIGEVKTSTKRFGNKEQEKLLEMAELFNPDTVMVSFSEGEDSDCSHLKDDLTANVKEGTEVRILPPSLFSRPNHTVLWPWPDS
jgi:hypothetical protein